MVSFGTTPGFRDVTLRPDSVTPQMAVISEPEYVVGIATLSSPSRAASALPKPVVEPPPMETVLLARRSRARRDASSRIVAGTCIRALAKSPAARSPNCSAIKRPRAWLPGVQSTNARSRPRASISPGSRSTAPIPNKMFHGSALKANSVKSSPPLSAAVRCLPPGAPPPRAPASGKPCPT